MTQSLMAPLAQRYRPTSYRELETYLGASDATSEWLEVAIRHLLHERDDRGDIRLEQLAASYGVKVNAIPSEHLRARAVSLEVLAIAPFVEVFLKGFRREHPRVVRDRTHEEDLLTYTLDAFAVTPAGVGEFECDVVQYYRLVRNHLMHRARSKQRKDELDLAADLHRRRSSTQFAKLNAPNPIRALEFDDVLLFTRALKVLAQRLCNVAQPSAAELLAQLKAKQSLVQTLRERNQKPGRAQRRLASYLRTEYGYGIVADAIAADLIANGLLAQR